jgi:hypothetical protein
MKTVPLFLAGALLASASFHAPTARAGIAQVCDVNVDVTDTDPKGTNVRAAPGGAILAAVTNPNAEGWVQVHVTGQIGDWYEIDRASLINAGLGPRGKTLFQGRGYLHKSMLGVSGMENTGTIYTDHDEKSQPLDRHTPGDQKVEMLGCWRDFLQVRVSRGTGWTKHACTNMDTTCS